MIDSLYVAWRYLRYHWGRSLTLVVCVTLIAVLPLALELLLDESERQLLARAEGTPLVVGAKGSSLDLAMNSLYFGDSVPEPISMAAVDAHRRHRAGAADPAVRALQGPRPAHRRHQSGLLRLPRPPIPGRAQPRAARRMRARRPRGRGSSGSARRYPVVLARDPVRPRRRLSAEDAVVGVLAPTQVPTTSPSSSI
jgi:hypothetical protein